MDHFLGTILIWPMDWAPQDWLICAGQELPISQYNALYSLLGTRYGGNGTTTFKLPDLRGRIPLGFGTQGTTTYPIGAAGGNVATTLTVSQLPAHNHTAVSTPSLTASVSADVKIPATSTAGNTTAPDAASYLALSPTIGINKVNIYNNDPNVAKNIQMPLGTVNATGAVAGTVATTVNNTGSGAAIDNRQPYLSLNFIICTAGIYPTRP